MGIREGLLLRQYIDERAGKAEEMKQRAKLYQAQAKGYEADVQLKGLQIMQALQMQRQLLDLYGPPEAGTSPGAPGSAPGTGPSATSPTPPAQYSQPLRDMLTQYKQEGAEVSVEPPPPVSPTTRAPASPLPLPAPPYQGTGQAPEPRADAALDQQPGEPSVKERVYAAGRMGDPPKIPGVDTLTPQFRVKVAGVAARLGMQPDDLLRIMSFETGGTFDPSVKNRAGSGATGLIQFMPETAKSLGTTTEALSRMTPEEQLDYVEKYLAPYTGKLGTLQDAYMAVLSPKAIGQPADTPLFTQGTTAYLQNAGLDVSGRGVVTVGDATQMVARYGAQSPQTPVTAPAPTLPLAPAPAVPPSVPRAPESRVAGPGAPAPAAETFPPMAEMEAISTRKALYGEAPPGTAPAPSAVPTTLQGQFVPPGPPDPEVNKLKRLSHILFANGKAQEGLAVVKYANEQQRLLDASHLYHAVLSQRSLSPEMRRQVLAAYGALLVQADKLEAAGQVMKSQLPLSGRELVEQADAQVRTVLLEQIQRGQAPDIGTARRIVQGEKLAQATAAAEYTTRAREETRSSVQAGRPAGEVLKDRALQYYERATGDRADATLPLSEFRQREKDKTIVQLSKAQSQQLDTIMQVVPIVAQIQDYVDQIYGPGGVLDNLTPQERLWLGSQRGLEQLMQQYPVLTAAARYVDANAEALARGLRGARGAMTEGDVERAKAALPNFKTLFDLRPGVGLTLRGPGLSLSPSVALPDTRDVAVQVTNDLVTTINNTTGAILGTKAFRHPGLHLGGGPVGASF